jgi:hypothetical protein
VFCQPPDAATFLACYFTLAKEHVSLSPEIAASSRAIHNVSNPTLCRFTVNAMNFHEGFDGNVY